MKVVRSSELAIEADSSIVSAPSISNRLDQTFMKGLLWITGNASQLVL